MSLLPQKDEKEVLTNSFKSQMGYGTATLSASTKKSTPKTQRYISRELQRTDTLMGIALKYGTTVQDLKKENKLWTNDNLFLRKSLLIPFSDDNQPQLDEHDSIVVYDGRSKSFTSSNESHDSASGRVSSTSDPLASYSSSSAAVLDSNHQEIMPSSSVQAFLSQNQSSGTKNAVNDDNSPDKIAADDFFSKYDNNIAKLKGEVAKMETNASRLDGLLDSNPLSLPPRRGASDKHASTERRARYVKEDSGEDSVLFIRSRTNAKEVQSKVERTQQATDDLFEL